MKQTLLLLVVTLSFSSYSQNEYSKLLYTNQASVYSNTVVNSDKNGILIGGIFNFDGAAINIDDTGNINWVQAFDGYFDFQEVIATNDSAFIMVGAGRNASLQHNTAHIIKINTLGDTLWTKNFDLGNSQSCSKAYVFEAADSNYVMAWSEENTARIGLVKLDQNGNVLWNKSFNGNFSVSTLTCIEALADSSIVIAGYNYNSVYTGFLVKLTNNGDLIWTKHFDDLLLENIMLVDSGFIAIGKSDLLGFEFSLSYLKFDNDGINEWHKKIVNGGHSLIGESISSIERVTDSTFMITSNGFWSNLAFLAKEGGTISSAFQYDMEGRDLLIQEDKSALIIGNGPLIGAKIQVFQPHIGLIKTDTLISTPYCSLDFILLADSTQTFPDSSISLIVSGTPIEYLSNITISTPVILDTALCVPFYGDLDEINSTLPVTVYPNSSTGFFNFEVNSIEEISITIIDSKGRTISTHNSIQSFTTIDLSSEADGFYYYKAVDHSGRQAHGKLILMK